jgi:hypothetical protein
MLTMSPSGLQLDEELRLYVQEFSYPFSEISIPQERATPKRAAHDEPRCFTTAGAASRSHEIFEEDEVVI